MIEGSATKPVPPPGFAGKEGIAVPQQGEKQDLSTGGGAS